MTEPITNTKFLADIKNGIANYGVFMLAITDRDTDADRLTSGYIYTIGHQERQRPDIMLVLYCKDKDTVTEELVMKRFGAGQRLINSIVEHWDTDPLLAGHTAQDSMGILYKAHDESEFTSNFKEFTFQASNYYGREEYPLLILMPTGYVQ